LVARADDEINRLRAEVERERAEKTSDRIKIE